MKLIEHSTEGIEEVLGAWQPTWRWGVEALDAFKDGRLSLALTDHNAVTKILRQVSPFKFEEAGSVPCGTFRPTVCDFNNDGSADLIFRADNSSTAFKNKDGVFTPIAFKYASGNPPIREMGYLDNNVFWFGHDFGRWQWNGTSFTPVSYSHPTPPCIADFLNEAWKNSKPNIPLRVWYDDFPRVTFCSGFTSYGGQKFLRAIKRDNDVTAEIGLPLLGSACFAGQLTADRQPELLVTGYGYYKVNPMGKYELQPGALTDCLKIVGPYIHQVRLIKRENKLIGLVVLNPRGMRTDIFGYENGEFKSLKTVGSWDGEPLTVCNLLGDTEPYILVGSGDSVRVFSLAS